MNPIIEKQKPNKQTNTHTKQNTMPFLNTHKHIQMHLNSKRVKSYKRKTPQLNNHNVYVYIFFKKRKPFEMYANVPSKCAPILEVVVSLFEAFHALKILRTKPPQQTNADQIFKHFY